MSATTTRIPASEAMAVAARFLARITPYCERVQIAGSLRRGAALVGDIEIVAVPKIEPALHRDMFDQVVATGTVDYLDATLTMLLDKGLVVKRPRSDGKTVWGQKMKYLTFEDVPIDLFTPDAKRFGLILLIRTGPAAYSHQLVTEKGKALVVGHHPNGRPITRYGLLPPHLKCEKGWLTSRTSGQPIETPEEEDVYRAIGVDWVHPSERR